MLVIRNAQLEALNRPYLQYFEKTCVQNVAYRFPARYSELGESKVRTMVHTAIARARGYGVVSSEDVESFLDLMVYLGEKFDEDEEFRYATEVLRDQTLPADARLPLAMERLGLERDFREEPEGSKENHG